MISEAPLLAHIIQSYVLYSKWIHFIIHDAFIMLFYIQIEIFASTYILSGKQVERINSKKTSKKV